MTIAVGRWRILPATFAEPRSAQGGPDLRYGRFRSKFANVPEPTITGELLRRAIAEGV